ncbi:MAG: M20/M25/M40 family metallo-hydrolase [Vicinamibacterales bacterium]
MQCTRFTCAVTIVLAWPVAAVAQQGPDIGQRLMRDTAVLAALDAIRADEPRTIEDQVRLCEVPAPPFKEAVRARVYAEAFRAAGLMNVRIDKEGNVLGERPGVAAPGPSRGATSSSSPPHLVFSAHLDTVFPEETNVKVTRDGSTLRGPGISDDCRGLAVVLAVVRALNGANVRTPGPITFVGTVGEEGLGDLRGVKALFGDTLKGRIDRFVSIDGATSAGITHIGVGSRRYRVTFKGPGGHSYGAFGIANPVHALGRVIEAISNFEVPSEPKTTFNVGRIGGGTSVNAIASESWMEVDMRSADPAALRSLDGRFRQAVARALAAENARWKNQGRLTVDVALVGERPAGRTAAASPIVEAAVSVTRALGITPMLQEGSTDANHAMGLSIPAITTGGGGRGSGGHALDEAWDSTNSWQGSQRALLLAIALSYP